MNADEPQPDPSDRAVVWALAGWLGRRAVVPALFGGVGIGLAALATALYDQGNWLVYPLMLVTWPAWACGTLPVWLSCGLAYATLGLLVQFVWRQWRG